jgi:DNA-binding MarR family transcriptional regulator
MPTRPPAKKDRPPARSDIEAIRADVAAYVAAGADESVQRVITAVHRLSRRLNRWSNVAPSSMTHRLDQMVSRGLIVRDADPDNRTRVLVRLTDEGYGLYAKAIRDADLIETDVLASLEDAQVDQLGDLLEQVIASLDDVVS